MQNDSTLLLAMPRMSTGSSGASCDVSLGFSWGSGSLRSLTPPWYCRFRFLPVKSHLSYDRVLWSTDTCSADMSWYIQVHAAGTDFLTCLIFRVQNPPQRTLNSWWAWGLSQKIIHSPFSCKAGFGCVFISSACFGHHHTQGKKLIICEWMSHFWWAGLIFNPAVWGSGSGWHGQNYSVQQIFISIKQSTVIKRLHPKMCCWKTAMP